MVYPGDDAVMEMCSNLLRGSPQIGKKSFMRQTLELSGETPASPDRIARQFWYKVLSPDSDERRDQEVERAILAQEEEELNLRLTAMAIKAKEEEEEGAELGPNTGDAMRDPVQVKKEPETEEPTANPLRDIQVISKNLAETLNMLAEFQAELEHGQPDAMMQPEQNASVEAAVSLPPPPFSTLSSKLEQFEHTIRKKILARYNKIDGSALSAEQFASTVLASL